MDTQIIDDGWHIACIWNDGTELSVEFEDSKPVMVCQVETEDKPGADNKTVQDEIFKAFQIWVRIGEWQQAEADCIVAHLTAAKEE